MKIRHRLLVLLAATAAVTLTIAGLWTYVLVTRAVEDRFIDRFRAELRLLEAALPDEADMERIGAVAGRWARILEVRLTIIGLEGEVLWDSSMPGDLVLRMDDHSKRPEVLRARESGFGVSERVSDTTGEHFLYIAYRAQGPGPVRYLRVALPDAVRARAEWSYLRPAVLLLLVTVLVLTLPAYVAVRSWSRPIERLVNGAERLASGELERPLPDVGRGEFAALAGALEKTRAMLLAKIGQLESNYHLLELVLGGMKEALIFVDGEQRVRLVNAAFKRVFAPGVSPEGRLLGEVLRHPQVLAAFEHVLETGEDRRDRVRMFHEGSRAFEAIVYPVRTDDPRGRIGAVGLFLDVTRIERLEETRREFVGNVSHELRTPLTSIKASAMTLQDGAAEDPGIRDRFLATIVRQVDRMNELVSDLTDLSRIETGAIQLEIRDVDLSLLVPDIVAQARPRYRDMELVVALDVPEGFLVRADRARLEQVLVNLIDNAMKFNRQGGEVHVRARKDESGGSIIEVEDTGDGIPSEAREKVFQRFFRVDPSRSRELGGTGLGLAIVKHLVNLHGGQIRVDSELGEGSCFVLEFPRDAAQVRRS